MRNKNAQNNGKDGEHGEGKGEKKEDRKSHLQFCGNSAGCL